MNELEAERPMSVEFSNLRGMINLTNFLTDLTDWRTAKISQRQGRRRRRLGEFGGPAREISPLPPVQTGELTLFGQYTSGMSMWQSYYNGS